MRRKTVSVSAEAYERLCSARRYPREPFSDVILRTVWPERTVTGAELLALRRRKPAFMSEEGLARIERAKRDDRPPDSVEP